MRKWHFSTALAILTVLTGCLGTGEDRVLTIEATGTVQGVVYFDANGTRELEEEDVPLALIGVRLLPFGSSDTIARATSNADGIFSIPRVPVGGYAIVVDPASVGEGAQVVALDPAEFFVQPNDSVTSFIAISYQSYTLAEARTRPLGEKLFVSGIALIRNGLFADSTLHIADRTGAIRATRVQRSEIFAGDSVRLLGEVGRRDGLWTLDNVTTYLLAIAGPPTPEQLTTGAAASADAGTKDAALVRIVNAEITDTATVNGDYELTVDDGTGAAVVLLDSDVPFSTLDPYVPGVFIDATGVLVPTGTGSWSIKPRSDIDLLAR